MVAKKRSGKGVKQSKLVYYLLAPARILKSVAHVYTNALSDCAGKIGTAAAPVGYTVHHRQYAQLPRSFSGGANFVKEGKDIEELRELIKVMTLRKVVENCSETDGRRKPRVAVDGGRSGRSYSVGAGRMGRIDEDVEL